MREANHAFNKQRKAMLRRKAREALDDAGIGYSECNNGAHLIVQGAVGLIDYWPGTGRWKTRRGVEGRGIKELLKRCSTNDEETNRE